MIANVPDVHLTQIKEWKRHIDNVVLITTEQVERVYRESPKTDRKTFALWVQEHCKELSPFMFKRYDGKDYTDLIYKSIKERG